MHDEIHFVNRTRGERRSQKLIFLLLASLPGTFSPSLPGTFSPPSLPAFSPVGIDAGPGAGGEAQVDVVLLFLRRRWGLWRRGRPRRGLFVAAWRHLGCRFVVVRLRLRCRWIVGCRRL